MEDFDVIVVGGGPAGAATAISARRQGASVLILDRADFPRDKACGDGIAPHALDVLGDLGVDDAVAGFEPLNVLRLSGPSGGEVRRTMRRPAHVVPREVFDARLLAAAVAQGAEVRRHQVREFTVEPDGVTIDGAYRSKTLVGADGASSVVRRALGNGHKGFAQNPPGHLAIAIRGYAEAPGGEPEQRIVTAGAEWPAYAWSFPIGDGRANVGYGEVLRGSPVTREHLLTRLQALLPELDIEKTESLRAHHLPLSTRRPPVGKGRVLLAGDALSLINPFTGEGIFYAVLSGKLAGEAAVRGDRAAPIYKSMLSSRLGQHLSHSRVASFLARQRSIVDASVRAAAAEQREFDALVELGLGDGKLTAATLGAVARHLVAK